MDRPGARTMPTLNGDVTFENVSAEYTTGTPVLRNVGRTHHAHPQWRRNI